MTLTLRKQICLPVERCNLAQCLRMLKVKCKNWNGKRRTHLTYQLGKVSISQLYDWYEEARKSYLKLCKKYRVDLTINHEIGVWLTTLWSHTQKLFKRRGIEIA